MSCAGWVFVPLALGAAGCASAAPRELIEARTAYAQVASGGASTLAPSDLFIAREALEEAERSFREHGDSYLVRDEAYAAERKAELAAVRAREASARTHRAEALAATQIGAPVRLTSALVPLRPSEAEAEPAPNGAAERAQRRASQAARRASQAASDLSRVASVKQDKRGLVITLGAAELFAPGKSELLAAALGKLGRVAEVLTHQGKDAAIRVEADGESERSSARSTPDGESERSSARSTPDPVGHGDAGSADELAQRRAEVVRDYLAAHGIAPDRLSAEGPAPSATSRGEAIEIVVEPEKEGAQER